MGEYRNNVAICIVALINAKDVEIPQTNRLQRMQLGISQAKLFSTQLGSPIGGIRLDRMIFLDGQGFQLTKNSRRRREHHLTHTMASCRLKNVKSPNHV